MSLVNRIDEDMKNAMRAKDRESLTTIRSIKAAFQNEQINKGSELSSDEEIAILSREKKQRLESIAEFKNADRNDLIEKTENEIKIIDNYLPEQLTDDEVKKIVNETIKEVDAQSMQDMGTVMGAVMPKVAGQADGSKINQLVREILSTK